MQHLKRFKESASQTAGPYIHIGAVPNFCGIEGIFPVDLGKTMVKEATKGPRITVKGQVFDGSGTPLRDALIEIWQADSQGIYPGGSDPRGPGDPHFTGFGRQAGDPATGEYTFETVKPGRVPFRDGRMMAPHITFWIVARGINIGLHTRMYFPEEAEANGADPVLARVELMERRATLIASAEDDGVYRFDVHLQGERETVFFDI